jgi:hypothetical protein
LKSFRYRRRRSDGRKRDFFFFFFLRRAEGVRRGNKEILETFRRLGFKSRRRVLSVPPGYSLDASRFPNCFGFMVDIILRQSRPNGPKRSFRFFGGSRSVSRKSASGHDFVRLHYFLIKTIIKNSQNRRPKTNKPKQKRRFEVSRFADSPETGKQILALRNASGKIILEDFLSLLVLTR